MPLKCQPRLCIFQINLGLIEQWTSHLAKWGAFLEQVLGIGLVNGLNLLGLLPATRERDHPLHAQTAHLLCQDPKPAQSHNRSQGDNGKSGQGPPKATNGELAKARNQLPLRCPSPHVALLTPTDPKICSPALLFGEGFPGCLEAFRSTATSWRSVLQTPHRQVFYEQARGALDRLRS